MGIQITREMFQQADPLSFNQEKVDELRQKHGVVPHFCNRKYRDERRGWGNLDPIETSDPMFADVYACLNNKPSPRNLKRVTKDGHYHQGDLVLSVISAEDYDIAQARRDYLANRRLRSVRDGDLVGDEIRRLGNPENVKSLDPEFEHVDTRGRNAIPEERGPGAPARGFVNPDNPPSTIGRRAKQGG